MKRASAWGSIARLTHVGGSAPPCHRPGLHRPSWVTSPSASQTQLRFPAPPSLTPAGTSKAWHASGGMKRSTSFEGSCMRAQSSRAKPSLACTKARAEKLRAARSAEPGGHRSRRALKSVLGSHRRPVSSRWKPARPQSSPGSVIRLVSRSSRHRLFKDAAVGLPSAKSGSSETKGTWCSQAKRPSPPSWVRPDTRHKWRSPPSRAAGAKRRTAARFRALAIIHGNRWTQSTLHSAWMGLGTCWSEKPRVCTANGTANEEAANEEAACACACLARASSYQWVSYARLSGPGWAECAASNPRSARGRHSTSSS
mmetsp:Transcript_20920/g.47196  ORF Transcript_20920/g.47196 Transcript_20920/m.47196 type:complete len:312 (-) Transcript_20920:459-1394(-)